MPFKSCKDFRIATLLFTLAGILAAPAFARGFAHPSTLEALEPIDRRKVVYFSTLGDTTLGFGTANFGYEIDGDWRFNIGAGLFYGASLGMGIRFRLLDTSEELRPFIGISVAGLYSNYSSELTTALTARGATGAYFFSLGGAVGGGLEWKFASGLYVGVGVNFWAWTHNQDTAIAPFFNFGYFFPTKSALSFIR